MPRRKISEYRAKTILSAGLGQPYEGVAIGLHEKWAEVIDALHEHKHYVVKVDQGIKGRFKKGLVKLGRSKAEVAGDIKELAGKGFISFLIEEQLAHDE